jgi:phosphatidylserine/phosphatidylglycerophosphate/cardiolipin synthase-like enzyme
LIINIFNYKKQTTSNFIIILVIGLIFILSFTAFAQIEVYFSLCDDDPESVIVNNIDNAKESINIAMYCFTEKRIADAIIRAKDRGGDIKIYLDYSQANVKNIKTSKFYYLINNGIDNIRISSNKYSMHNKFAIIDNAIVITGSYNWTAYAGGRNDENLLVIKFGNIVKEYQDQFYHLWDKYSQEKYQKLINEKDKES